MNKTKKVIFESGIKIFSIYGYDGATMDEIASNAGVAKGTLYYHFKSKQEIFEYIVEEGMKIIQDEVEYRVNRQEECICKLRTLCKTQLNLLYQNREFFKVIMSHLCGQEIRNLQIRNVIQTYIEFIEEILKEAMNEGKIKKGKPSFMAYIFLGTLYSAEVYELINGNEQEVDEVIDELMTYTLKGIEI
ncbi:TetR/AcrR family transcriptional regulator [Haloimpatiens sp. FM7330]|uniref:TetR/AcrR family transcriptional regulator n=1 Tax=Haloimpatiens sp. FM7330 TaxID=3298610 RepID=UPI00363FA9C5